VRDIRNPNAKVGRYQKAPVTALKKALAARPAPVRRQPSLEPISKSQARVYASHPHQSTQSVRANIISRAALGRLAPDIAASRLAAPGPAVSGYNALSSAVGRNVAARIPGMLTKAGRRPHATLGGTLADLAIDNPFLPFGRLGTVAKLAGAGERETGRGVIRLGGKPVKLGRADVIAARHLVGLRESGRGGTRQRQRFRSPNRAKRSL
jgi:hypothetical protein